MTDLITLALGAGLGCWFIALLRLARTAGARHAPHPAFRPVETGTVWRACHDMACGHMTTRWVPAGPGGAYRCEHADRHRGDIHFTHTNSAQGEPS